MHHSASTELTAQAHMKKITQDAHQCCIEYSGIMILWLIIYQFSPTFLQFGQLSGWENNSKITKNSHHYCSVRQTVNITGGFSIQNQNFVAGVHKGEIWVDFVTVLCEKETQMCCEYAYHQMMW